MLAASLRSVGRSVGRKSRLEVLIEHQPTGSSVTKEVKWKDRAESHERRQQIFVRHTQPESTADIGHDFNRAGQSIVEVHRADIVS